MDTETRWQSDLYTNGNPVQGETANLAGFHEVNGRVAEKQPEDHAKPPTNAELAGRLEKSDGMMVLRWPKKTGTGTAKD